MAKLVKQEVEKNSPEKLKTERRFVKLGEAVDEKNIKKDHGIPMRRFDAARPLSPLTDILGDEVASPKACSTTLFPDESKSHRYYTRRQEVRNRRHRTYHHHSILAPPAKKLGKSKSSLKFLVAVIDGDRKAVGNRSYRLIYKLQE